MADAHIDQQNWKYRRRYLIAVTAFVMGLMLWATVMLPGAEIAETIISNGYYVLASFTAIYVFGAAWEGRRNWGKQNTVEGTVTTTTASTVTQEVIPATKEPL